MDRINKNYTNNANNCENSLEDFFYCVLLLIRVWRINRNWPKCLWNDLRNALEFVKQDIQSCMTQNTYTAKHARTLACIHININTHTDGERAAKKPKSWAEPNRRTQIASNVIFCFRHSIQLRYEKNSDSQQQQQQKTYNVKLRFFLPLLVILLLIIQEELIQLDTYTVYLCLFARLIERYGWCKCIGDCCKH